MEISDLPAVNATLNAIATVFLLSGYVLIRRGHEKLHKRCMLGALATSALFRACYAVYHLNAGSRPFPGQGVSRLVSFTILLTHVPLAAVILPLALTAGCEASRRNTIAMYASRDGRCRCGCTSR